jgi:hypothetical protein
MVGHENDVTFIPENDHGQGLLLYPQCDPYGRE